MKLNPSHPSAAPPPASSAEAKTETTPEEHLQNPSAVEHEPDSGWDETLSRFDQQHAQQVHAALSLLTPFVDQAVAALKAEPARTHSFFAYYASGESPKMAWFHHRGTRALSKVMKQFKKKPELLTLLEGYGKSVPDILEKQLAARFESSPFRLITERKDKSPWNTLCWLEARLLRKMEGEAPVR